MSESMMNTINLNEEIPPELYLYFLYILLLKPFALPHPNPIV